MPFRPAAFGLPVEARHRAFVESRRGLAQVPARHVAPVTPPPAFPDSKTHPRSLLVTLARPASNGRDTRVERRLESMGARVISRSPSTRSISIACPDRLARALLAGHGWHGISRVEERGPGRLLGMGAGSRAAYLCTGEPSPAVGDTTDLEGCEPRWTSGAGNRSCATSECPDVVQCHFLDANIGALNGFVYRDRGYEGDGIEVGVIDRQFLLQHPGWWGADGDIRVKCVYTRRRGESELRGYPAEEYAAENAFAYDTVGPHGTKVASIIGGDLRAGHDRHLGTRGAAALRAHMGLAPKVWFHLGQKVDRYDVTFAGAPPTDLLDYFLYMVDIRDPVDLLNLSIGIAGAATEEEARGLDLESQKIDLAFDLGTLCIRAAGNDHGVGYAEDWQESSAPAGRTALSVGTLAPGCTAPVTRRSEALSESSSGSNRPDGRTCPELVAPHHVCGVMSCGPYYRSSTDSWCLDGTLLYGHPVYGHFSHTSSATPHVTGAAALFKEWFLDPFGLAALSNHQLVACLLNMADRYVGRRDTLRPQPRWGLGRFRLRDWDYDENGKTGNFFSEEVLLGAGETYAMRIGLWWSGEVPAIATRLSAVAWWNEENTAEGQEKPLVYLYLPKHADSIWWKIVDYSNNDNEKGGEQHVSLAFDLCDPPKPCLDGRGTYVLVVGVATCPETQDGSSTRRIAVSCAWEAGEDESLVDCAGWSKRALRCRSGLGSPCDERISNADLPLSWTPMESAGGWAPPAAPCARAKAMSAGCRCRART